MHKITGFLGIILAVSACHSGNEPYHNVDKWVITRDQHPRRLKDSPKTVTECEYSAADANRPDKKHLLYNRFSFNKDGDLISRKAYMSDSLVSEDWFQYDDNGIQSKTKAMKAPDSAWTNSWSLGGGRYKSISRGTLHAPKTWIITFSNNGQDCLEERYSDSTAKGQPIASLHRYFEGTRLMRQKSFSKDESLEAEWYYSKWDTPDSIAMNGGLLFHQKEIFRNNSWGDPVFYYQISGQDTAIKESYRYEYDQHGNWTKRICTTLHKDVIYGGGFDKEPYIVEREYQY
jgi:hypothetical protein